MVNKMVILNDAEGNFTSVFFSVFKDGQKCVSLTTATVRMRGKCWSTPQNWSSYDSL